MTPTSFDRATRCSGGPTPGALALYRWLQLHGDVTAYGPDGQVVDHGMDVDVGGLGIYNCRNVRGGASLSDHAEGRAIDLALNASDVEDLARGWAICRALAAEASQLGVQLLVWARQSWNNQRRAWQPYGGSNPHTDHIHCSLNRWGAANVTTALCDDVLGPYLEDDMSARAEQQIDELHRAFIGYLNDGPFARPGGVPHDLGTPILSTNHQTGLLVGHVERLRPQLAEAVRAAMVSVPELDTEAAAEAFVDQLVEQVAVRLVRIDDSA